MAGDTCEADESFVVTSGSNEGGKTGRGTQKTIVNKHGGQECKHKIRVWLYGG
jgi:hypothetical protein